MRDSKRVSSVPVPPGVSDRALRTLSSGSLHGRIEDAISAFGRDVLTAREQAVVQLILRGLSSKVVASELQIALKTEKVHRRNAYAKLGVNSHAVLFGQFLQFLSSSMESSSGPKFGDANRAVSTDERHREIATQSITVPRPQARRAAAWAPDPPSCTLRQAMLRDVRHR